MKSTKLVLGSILCCLTMGVYAAAPTTMPITLQGSPEVNQLAVGATNCPNVAYDSKTGTLTYGMPPVAGTCAIQLQDPKNSTKTWLKFKFKPIAPHSPTTELTAIASTGWMVNGTTSPVHTRINCQTEQCVVSFVQSTNMKKMAPQKPKK